MKLLYLIYDHINNPWVGGGGAVRANEISKRLANRGHDVTIFSGNYSAAKDYQEDGVKYRFAGNSRNYIASTFTYAFKAAGFVMLNGSRYDLIIEDFAPWNPVFSCLLTKKPVILHINHIEGRSILRRWFILGLPFFLLEKFYPHLFSHSTALSEETRNKVKMPNIPVVPAGINSGLMDGRVNYPFCDKAKVCILYIGRLHIKNKGLDTLLSAMQISGVKLVLAGKGRDEKKLKAMVRKLELTDVEFAGFISEDKKKDLLRECLFLILPSRYEGWGIVVLEAAACGKPVIVSDIPELRYAVEAGFGVSFRAGDAKDLAAKMQLLINNEPLRRKMGQEGRKYAGNYTWDRIAETYEKYLIKIHNSCG